MKSFVFLPFSDNHRTLTKELFLFLVDIFWSGESIFIECPKRRFQVRPNRFDSILVFPPQWCIPNPISFQNRPFLTRASTSILLKKVGIFEIQTRWIIDDRFVNHAFNRCQETLSEFEEKPAISLTLDTHGIPIGSWNDIVVGEHQKDSVVLNSCPTAFLWIFN